jgi:hypothetical protein
MSNRIRDFVRRCEETYYDSQERSREALIELEWYLEFLNNLYSEKSNKRYGSNKLERLEECNRIRESINNTYEHINFYKDCMKYEEIEMKRIYNTWVHNKNTEIDGSL